MAPPTEEEVTQGSQKILTYVMIVIGILHTDNDTYAKLPTHINYQKCHEK